MNLTYITKRLNTHEKCVKYLEKRRWQSTPKCPYCGSHKSNPKQLRHTCSSCNNSFSVTVGTVFQNSNLPLNKWFMAIELMLSAKKGISALQLARDLSVNKNTAWLLQMKIRAAMNEDEDNTGLFKREKPVTRIVILREVGSPRIKTKKLNGGEQFTQIYQGYWNHLKRAIIGQYHRIDEHYLFRYVDEISFKYHRRSLPDKGYADLMLRLLPA